MGSLRKPVSFQEDLPMWSITSVNQLAWRIYGKVVKHKLEESVLRKLQESIRVNRKLREEQASFTARRSCLDHLITDKKNE